jgi:hypothetical protein
MPSVYKPTKTIKKKRFEISNCIKPKMASKVEERENRSAFFMVKIVEFVKCMVQFFF